MAKGEIFEARVESIAAGGAGLARVGGKSVFIEFTAPGDRIRGRIETEHKNWATGELLEVLEPSPQRARPLCRYFGLCGGCSLQHLAYEAQIEAKTAILRDAFTRIGGITPPEIHLRRSEPYEYRNRVQFHCTALFNHSGRFQKAADKTLCFRERKSSRLVAVNDCPVAEAGIRKALQEGKIIPPHGKERFTVFSRGNVFLSEGTLNRGKVPILNREIAMDVCLFFQSNIAMLEFLIGDLLALLPATGENYTMADIYCGIGTFAAFLGGKFSEIDLVEENRQALSLTRENMPPGKKVNYYAQSDTDWARSQKKKHYDFVVLDPPRKGLSGPFREYLAGNRPRMLAYVSCDSATLARDSRSLLEGGYALKELNLYDFYPQTAHIESLAVFCRNKPE